MDIRATSLVFRRLTHADFSHINNRGSHYSGGGGQSYIDFPIANIHLESWYEFLGPHTSTGESDRPVWNFPINSLGLDQQIILKIFQRRAASVSIASQKIDSRASNRVPAWHTDNSFPIEYNPESDNLVVYIIKSSDGAFWAGWFLKKHPSRHWQINYELNALFTNSAGYINFQSQIFIDTENNDWPFKLSVDNPNLRIKTEDDIIEALVDEDTSPSFQLPQENESPSDRTQRVIKIRQRNPRIARNLKRLYEGRCQITGEDNTFKKRNGDFYSELHHIIPLGDEGSDSYANTIVVNPLIHRMLHYANVGEIDLSIIEGNELEITINDSIYTIKWHSDHYNTVRESLE